jgi:hypothetical protein
MKRFMKLMSIVLVLGAVATASTVGGNPEVSVGKNNPTTVLGHCDPYERLAGLCRNSQNILQEN